MQIGVIGLGRMGANIDPEAKPKAPPVEPAAKHAAE